MVKVLSYDKENDILFIHKGFTPDEKFRGNIDAGELVLDVSTKGRVRGIEIMNASDFLREFKINKIHLENLTDAKFNVSIRPDSIIIGILFVAKNKEEIPAKIAVPLKSPKVK